MRFLQRSTSKPKACRSAVLRARHIACSSVRENHDASPSKVFFNMRSVRSLAFQPCCASPAFTPAIRAMQLYDEPRAFRRRNFSTEQGRRSGLEATHLDRVVGFKGWIFGL